MQYRQMGNGLRWHRQVGEIHCRELDEYADSLTGVWDLEAWQLGPSRMETRTRYVADESALLYRERMGMASMRRGSLVGDRVVFGIPSDLCRSGCWQGGACPEGSLVVVRSGVSLDLVFPPGSIVTVIVLPAERVRSRLEALAGRWASELNPRDGIFLDARPQALRSLSQTCQRILKDSRVECGRPLADELIDAVATAQLEEAEFVDMPCRAARHTYRRAMEVCGERGLELHPESLALELGVCVRTLREAFRSCTGTSPCQFLRQLRLQRVRERLLELGPGDTSVTREAVAMGFTELGRFAGEYRQVFGEPPSITLRRGIRRKGIVMAGPQR